MTYYLCKVLSFGMLIGGAVLLCSAVSAEGPERIRDTITGLSTLVCGVLAVRIDRGVPAYLAVEELRYQIGKLIVEGKTTALSRHSTYDDTLLEANFFLDVANAKRKHREWRAAIHAVNLGKQKIQLYRDATAATNADQRNPQSP